jgi:hypothetical protein
MKIIYHIIEIIIENSLLISIRFSFGKKKLKLSPNKSKWFNVILAVENVRKI